MNQPSRKPPHPETSPDGGRKRVGKACDRCRLKKSKCDGALPCSRCKADNAICVFGERRKLHDKVYPKGYVEMLEQQQGQLVAGLREMYQRLQSVQAWDGPVLSETTGHPLTHDILAALDLLETRHDDSGEFETFEDDVQVLRAKLLAEGAGFTQRRGSFSSESDHSSHQRSVAPDTPQSTTMHSNTQHPFARSTTVPIPPTAVMPTHPPRSSATMPTTLPSGVPLVATSPFYQSQWTFEPTGSDDDYLIPSQFDLSASDVDPDLDGMDGGDGLWNTYDMASMTTTAGTYPPQLSHAMGQGIDPMDLELNQYLQVMS